MFLHASTLLIKFLFYSRSLVFFTFTFFSQESLTIFTQFQPKTGNENFSEKKISFL